MSHNDYSIRDDLVLPAKRFLQTAQIHGIQNSLGRDPFFGKE
jgi:hypothetical protein